MTLLLVDDEASLLQLLGQHLTRSGHTVESAATVAAAQQAIAKSSFDAAILDFTLPDGSGLDLGFAILAGDPDIKVIFTSGYPLEMEVVPVDLRPRVHVLQKPFMPRALAEILKNL